jgi:hypothetical protein
MQTTCTESPAGPPSVHLPSNLAVQDSPARPRIGSGSIGTASSHAPLSLSNSEDPGLAPVGAGETANTDRTNETSGGSGPSLQFVPHTGKGRVPELSESHSFRNGKVSICSSVPTARSTYFCNGLLIFSCRFFTSPRKRAICKSSSPSS